MAAVASTEGIEARAAYLDLVEPELSAVAVDLAAAGHRSAVVVPLLFTRAFHAEVDVPQALAAATAVSGVELQLGDILGTGAELEVVLLASLAGSATDSDPVLLYAVGSSDAAANAAVHHLAERLSRHRSAPVRVGFGTCEPRARPVLSELEQASGRVVVLPLFLAPGLLLDPVQAYARERRWPVVEPLAERAAPILARRYQDRALIARSLG